MIYVFRYCPAVFYCIPITYFTSAQCKQIQTPFINALLPRLRINRHVKRAVIWGPAFYGGLELKHMETEQIAKTVESLISHVRASTPTGMTFVISCEMYQMLLGVQQQFFLLDPEICPHRPPATTCKITYVWETLRKIQGYLMLPKMWTPQERDKPCIMDMVLQARSRAKGTVRSIKPETVGMVNACRLWLRALYIKDLMNDDGTINGDLFYGRQRCTSDLHFPTQERPPNWVWKVWSQTLHQVCVLRNSQCPQLTYFPFAVTMVPTMPSIILPSKLDLLQSLKDIV